jgi:hypothetical protein
MIVVFMSWLPTGEMSMRSKSVLTLMAFAALLMMPARHAFAGIYCQSLWATELQNVENYCDSTGQNYHDCKNDPVTIGLYQDMASDYAGCMKMVSHPYSYIQTPAAPIPISCYWGSAPNTVVCAARAVDPRQLFPFRESKGRPKDCSVQEHVWYRQRERPTQII